MIGLSQLEFFKSLISGEGSISIFQYATMQSNRRNMATQAEIVTKGIFGSLCFLEKKEGHEKDKQNKKQMAKKKKIRCECVGT